MGHLQSFLAGPRDDASLEGTAAACEACTAQHAELAACSSTAAAAKLALAALQPEADVKGSSSSSAPVSAPAAANAQPAKIKEKRRGKKKGPSRRRENRVTIQYCDCTDCYCRVGPCVIVGMWTVGNGTH